MRETIYPYALLSRAIPLILFTPVIVVMLGRGLPPIIFTVAFTVYFPTFLNMMRGLRSASLEYHETLHTLSATPLQRLRLVDLPSSTPYLLENNRNCYGYRRIHAALARGGKQVSEKVVLRLMREEQLVVDTAKRRRYTSYQGELDPAPETSFISNPRRFDILNDGS